MMHDKELMIIQDGQIISRISLWIDFDQVIAIDEMLHSAGILKDNQKLTIMYRFSRNANDGSIDES